MTEDANKNQPRRRFLKLVGGGAVMIPIIGFAGCSGEKDATPAATPPTVDTKPPPPKVEPVAEPPAPVEATGASGDLIELAEDDAQAKALGYVHDADVVDSGQQPRFQAGQNCANCTLYQGDAREEWGGCSIFPGKRVKAAGWCNVYAAKPS